MHFCWLTNKYFFWTKVKKIKKKSILTKSRMYINSHVSTLWDTINKDIILFDTKFVKRTYLKDWKCEDALHYLITSLHFCLFRLFLFLLFLFVCWGRLRCFRHCFLWFGRLWGFGRFRRFRCSRFIITRTWWITVCSL